MAASDFGKFYAQQAGNLGDFGNSVMKGVDLGSQLATRQAELDLKREQMEQLKAKHAMEQVSNFNEGILKGYKEIKSKPLRKVYFTSLIEQGRKSGLKLSDAWTEYLSKADEEDVGPALKVMEELSKNPTDINAKAKAIFELKGKVEGLEDVVQVTDFLNKVGKDHVELEKARIEAGQKSQETTEKKISEAIKLGLTDQGIISAARAGTTLGSKSLDDWLGRAYQVGLDKVVNRRDNILEEARKNGVSISPEQRKSLERITPQNVESAGATLNKIEDRITAVISEDKRSKNAADIQKSGDERIDKNRSRYETIRSKYRDGVIAAGNIKSVLENIPTDQNGIGIADNALMAAFDALRSNKSSVLREGDEDRIRAAVGLKDRLFNYIDQFTLGARLTKDQREMLGKVADELSKTARKNLKNEVTPIYVGLKPSERPLVFSPDDLEMFKGGDKKTKPAPKARVDEAGLQEYIRLRKVDRKKAIQELNLQGYDTKGL